MQSRAGRLHEQSPIVPHRDPACRQQSKGGSSLNQCSATDVPPQVSRSAANFYTKLHIHTSYFEKGNSYLPPSIVLSNMCYVLFSYACILLGQVFICRHIFMAMYSFVPPFRQATFCGVPSCVFDKSVCAAGEKRLRNTGLNSVV
jgi:hypothetical protein